MRVDPDLMVRPKGSSQPVLLMLHQSSSQGAHFAFAHALPGEQLLALASAVYSGAFCGWSPTGAPQCGMAMRLTLGFVSEARARYTKRIKHACPGAGYSKSEWEDRITNNLKQSAFPWGAASPRLIHKSLGGWGVGAINLLCASLGENIWVLHPIDLCRSVFAWQWESMT